MIAAGIAGLFQDVFRPIVTSSAATKPLADLLYTYTGLSLRGAAATAMFDATFAFEIGTEIRAEAVARRAPEVVDIRTATPINTSRVGRRRLRECGRRR